MFVCILGEKWSALALLYLTNTRTRRIRNSPTVYYLDAWNRLVFYLPELNCPLVPASFHMEWSKWSMEKRTDFGCCSQTEQKPKKIALKYIWVHTPKFRLLKASCALSCIPLGCNSMHCAIHPVADLHTTCLLTDEIWPVKNSRNQCL